MLLVLWMGVSLGINVKAQTLKPLALEFEGSKAFGNQRLLEIATKCRADSAKLNVAG